MLTPWAARDSSPADTEPDSLRNLFPFATPHLAGEAEPQGALRLRLAVNWERELGRAFPASERGEA